MYTRNITITIIERSDVASVLFYRWKDGAYVVTFTDGEAIYTFTGKYSSDDVDVKGKLYKFKKGGSMDLIGQASMHGSVMNSILSMWNNHIKEIEENA